MKVITLIRSIKKIKITINILRMKFKFAFLPPNIFNSALILVITLWPHEIYKGDIHHLNLHGLG